MDPAERDPYETLGLNPTATPGEIKQAYRDLARVWHPDRFAGDPRLQQVADEKLKRINEAYEALKGRGVAGERGRRDRSRPGTAPPPASPASAPGGTDQAASRRAARRQHGPLARHPLASVALVAVAAAVVAILVLVRLPGTEEAPPAVAVEKPERASEPEREPERSRPVPAADAGSDRAEAGPAGGAFGLRATPVEVRAAMGRPSRVQGNVWWYGPDRVVFQDGRVVGWANPAGGLRLEIETADESGIRVPDFGVEVEHEASSPVAPVAEEEDDWWWKW